MKIEKTELAKGIEKLKSVVPKSSDILALMGILVKDGQLVASNGEMTVKAKLEGIEGEESFIIPAKAFDLIKNLPDGELSVTSSPKHVVTLKTGRIKNSYQSLDPDTYPFSADQIAENENIAIPTAKMKEAISHVLYAIPPKAINPIMGALCLKAKNSKLNFVGLDGHVLAWAQMDFEDADGSFELLIPKTAVEKLLSLDMGDEVAIQFNHKSAIFRSENYEINTRLVEGKYIAYDRMFTALASQTSVNRHELLGAVTRANLCTEQLTTMRFCIKGDLLQIDTKDNTTDYLEEVQLQDSIKDITIGFNPRLLLETLKAFDGDDILMELESGVQPMIMSAHDGDMKSAILPVRLGG